MLELHDSYDIKHDIPETFKGVVSRGATNAKQFLVEIYMHFVKSDKAEKREYVFA